MKTIPVEQLNERLAHALELQDEHEAIGLTRAADTVAWVLRVPEAMKDSEADVVVHTEGPDGRVFVIVQAKHAIQRQPGGAPRTPVFGAGRGTLTMISEDDDHLKDFREYME
jgi:crotonobetainyl-CoA:carnitine CoA-transferase CaiB-like acyl-CoA transferase